ncbi:hypothetical protein [Bacteroides sedimenti]
MILGAREGLSPGIEGKLQSEDKSSVWAKETVSGAKEGIFS